MDGAPNEPRNHHWLTRGFMVPWVGDDGLVESFFRPHERVVARRKSPKSIGSERDLYRIEAEKVSDPAIFERIFGRVEDRALKIRDKLLDAGVSALSADERQTFAYFLALLLVRRPEYVLPKIDAAQTDWESRLSSSLQPQISAGAIDFDDLRARVQGHGKILVLQAMAQSAASFAHQIETLSWRTFDVSSGGLPLVLADFPFRMWSRSGGRLELMTLPLSPEVAFVAGQGESWAEVRYREEFRQTLAIDFIGEQFRSARRFVIGKDKGPHDSYIDLAERYLIAKK